MARLPGQLGAFLSKLISDFEALVQRILARIAGRAADQVAAAPHPLGGDDLGVVRALWLADVDEQLLPALEAVWTASAGQTLDGLSDVERAVADITAPDAAQFLRAARNRLAGIGDQLWRDAREQLAQGVEDGDDIPALAARVRATAGVTAPRALVIARTEVVSAHNAASIGQARMLDDPHMVKEWISTPDERTRPEHRAADGQRVRVGEAFHVGEARLDFPGDPTGPPDMIINCRCSMAFDVDDAPPLAAAGYDDQHHVHRDGNGKFAHTGVGAVEGAAVKVTDEGGLIAGVAGTIGDVGSPTLVRDPHASTWHNDPHSAFGRHNLVIGSTVKTRGGDLDVGVDGDGLHLGFGHPARNTSGALDRDAAWDLAKELRGAADNEEHGDGPELGRSGRIVQHAVHHFTADDLAAERAASGYAHVERHGKNDVRLELHDNEQQLSMTGAEARALADVLERHGSSQRVQTGAGPMDVFVPGSGQLGLRMKDDAGRPTDVVFKANDWAKIQKAMGVLIDGIDEDNPDVNAPSIDRLVVQTGHGPVELKWRGPRADRGYAPTAGLTVVPLDETAPWSIHIDGDHMADVFAAIGHAESGAQIDTSEPMSLKKATAGTVGLGARSGSDVAFDSAVTAAGGYDDEHHVKRDTRGKFSKVAGGTGPLTDVEFAARQALVEDVIGEARKTLATEVVHAQDGAWSPERDKIHRQIARDLYKAAGDVPTDGKAVIAGGLGGAGKSTVLRDHAGIDSSQYLTVNPDDIKEEMARRNLIPEVPDHPELSPMERAALVHEESSRIGLMLADMAYKDRKNVIWDVTMSSEGSAKSRIDALKSHGYEDVRGVFVDIPVDVSVDRAMARYRRGVDQWRGGSGLGGRFVPPSIIRAQRTTGGHTVNREVFDRLQNNFTAWSIYDNSVSGRQPKLVGQGGGPVVAAAKPEATMRSGKPVGQVLDDLAAGRVSVDEAAADFAARTWPRLPATTDAQAWGVVDDPAPAPDSWTIVNADSRLSPADYQTLAAAYRSAPKQDAAAARAMVPVDDSGTITAARSGVDMHLPDRHDQMAHGHRYATGDPAQLVDVVPDDDGDPDSPDEVPEHTGAMIALIPTDADAARLAVDGGEPAVELHCTLSYLGQAVDIPEEIQAQLLDAVTEAFTGWPVVRCDAFSLSIFNPGDATEHEPCVTVGLSGDELQHVHGVIQQVVTTVVDANDTTPEDDPTVTGWQPPDTFLPWIPHITLTYTVDPAQLVGLVDRVGPVTFDRIRIAYAGQNTDVALSPVPAMPGDGQDTMPEPGAGNTAPDGGMPQVAAGRDWLSHMPLVLRRYWIKHLAPWGHGSFTRCVAELGHYYPHDPKGTCANLHKEATGRWPGEGQHHQVGEETIMAGKTPATPAAPLPAGPPPPAAGCPDGQHPDPATGDCVPDPACPDGQHIDPATGSCVDDTQATAGPPTAADGAPPPAVPAPGPGPDGGLGEPCPDGQHLDPATGDCVDDTPMAAAQVEHWHALMHEEGISTGMRTFTPGALTWRVPPFAFHWQRNSSAHGGMPETVQVGNVLRAERDADNTNQIHGWGNLDLDSPEGLDFARRLANRFVAWVSIGLDEQPVDVEFVWPDDQVEGDGEGGTEMPGIDVLFAEPTQEIYHSGRIGELTAVSVPAQDCATIQPTRALLDELAARGVLTAAAVASHSTGTADDTWDGPAAEAALPSPVPLTAARAEYAWVDDSQADGDTVPKSACKFPHHDVGADGSPGAANLSACSSVIGALHGGRGGAAIPDADRKGVYDHVAKHLRDAGQEPPELRTVPLVAAGHTIEIPHVPPAWWFQRPTDVVPHGALTITDEGRVYGYVAPAGVAHRSFPGQRVTVPMGNVDYARWMGAEAIVAGGGRVVAGPITMECGHLPPAASSSSIVRMEHYDNACSVVAKACVGEDQHGVWIAGALEPGVTADQVSRMLACRLSGDWAAHPERPGWREFVAALLVPVPGFAEGRTAPSVPTLRLNAGALVASAVPVRLVRAGTDRGLDLRPALERLARSIGRDRHSRLEALRARVHGERG